VNSADEKRGFTSDDRTRTLLEAQAITPRVARKELAAACRAKGRMSQPDSRQSRGAWNRAKALRPDSRRSRITARATEKRRDVNMSRDMASSLSANTT
jgi:hypothetical protein